MLRDWVAVRGSEGRVLSLLWGLDLGRGGGGGVASGLSSYKITLRCLG